MLSIAINLRASKVCLKCIELKPLSEFHRDALSPDRLVPHCKPCRREFTASWRSRPGKREAGRAAALVWRNANLERARKNTRAYHQKFRARVQASRRLRLLRAYGLLPEEFDAMMGAQNGLCAICGGINDGRALAIDHAHVSGFLGMPPHERAQYVRGLLCDSCNKGIGHFRDESALLAGAIAYLGGRRG